MKQCRKCNLIKSFNDFTKNKREKDGYRRVCQLCSSTYERDRYHKDESIRYVRHVHAAGREGKVQRNRIFLFNYLLNHSCVDCNESDPIVLEFDHIKDKKYNVSHLIAAGYSIAKISEEIKKCEVRCANCHRRKTSKQFNWYNKTAPFLSEKMGARNKLEKLRREVTLYIRGEDVKTSKLKTIEVIEIKKLLLEGKTSKEISIIYNVSLKTICNINNGKTWKQVII